MELVVMAAGMGSRFGGLKQIQSVDDYGNFILDYSVYDAMLAGFSKVIFIIKQENFEVFKNTIGRRIENRVKVEYVFQSNDNLPSGYTLPKSRVKPLGTGHALLCAKNAVTEEFCVINADDFYGRGSFEAVAQFLKTNKNNLKLALVSFEVQNTLSKVGDVKRGLCETNGDRLVSIKEHLITSQNGKLFAKSIDTESSDEFFEIDGHTPTSVNMFGLNPSVFLHLQRGFEEFLEKNAGNLETAEYFLPSELAKLKNQNYEIVVINSNEKFMGLTYREDMTELKAYLKKLNQKKMYQK